MRVVFDGCAVVCLVSSASVACADVAPHPRHAGDPATPPDTVVAALSVLARDALRANAEMRVHGDIEAVLRRRPSAPRYRAAMWPAFRLTRYLRGVSERDGVRYVRSEIAVEPAEVCRVGSTVRMLVREQARFDMAPVRPGGAMPPYTAGAADHLFYFEQVPELGAGSGAREWVVTYHHEVSLAERHDHAAARRLLHPCA
jgi:hypothetical protein